MVRYVFTRGALTAKLCHPPPVFASSHCIRELLSRNRSGPTRPDYAFAVRTELPETNHELCIVAASNAARLPQPYAADFTRAELVLKFWMDPLGRRRRRPIFMRPRESRTRIATDEVACRVAISWAV